MWSYEYGAETAADPGEIWRVWLDVTRWPEWNGDIERIEIDGPFAAGTTIRMTPRGAGEVRLVLADVRENEQFVDGARVDGLVVTTTHRIDRGSHGRVRVVYRTEIDGEHADRVGPEIGRAITADFPDTVTNLIRRAEDREKLGASPDVRC